MKNIIPLVVSVVLGLAAVYIVSKLLFEQEDAGTEDMVSVVVAARDLDANDDLLEGSLTYRDIPLSAMPKNALLWENVGLAYGQTLPHAVAQDDYILMTDIRIQTTLSDCARQGEWTVPVTFSDPALVKMLMPDDEIAIISTYVSSHVTVDKEMTQSDGSGVPIIVGTQGHYQVVVGYRTVETPGIVSKYLKVIDGDVRWINNDTVISSWSLQL